MKRLILAFLCALVLSLNAYGAALPVSKMQNAVSGVTQSRMQSRGFATNDPRYGYTLAGIGATLAADAAGAATVTALGVTAPAWVTVAAPVLAVAAVGTAVYFAIDAGLKWLLKDANDVQIGDNPQTVNTPAGLAPPTILFCYNSTCAASLSAACTGQPRLADRDLNGTTMTQTWVFSGGACTIHLTPKTGGGAGSNLSPATSTTKTSNTTVCPGTSLTASGGKCPASNLIEPPGAPVKTISDAAADLTPAQKAGSLDPQIVADLANQFWKAAASAPGYQGLPYDATQPISSADAAAWQAANPAFWPSVGDFVAPQAAPSGGTAAAPFTLPASTSPVASADPAAQPSAGVNPPTQPLENLGTDPGIGSPALEPIPTAQQILSPLMNLFPSLKNFVVPSIDASCPHWSFAVFDRQITMVDHCTLLENIRPTLFAAMAAAYALMALLIVLAA